MKIGTPPAGVGEVAWRDQTWLAGCLGLVFIAVPAVSVVAPSFSDATAIGAGYASMLPIATRLRSYHRLALPLSCLVLAYAASALVTTSTGQGFRHTLTTFATAAAFLLFTCYGRDMVEQRWFRQAAGLLVLCGVIAIVVSASPKNITGGTMLYLLALGTLILINQRPSGAWFYSKTFFAIAVALALALNIRSMVAYGLLLLCGYVAATRLPRRLFWLLGILVLSVINVLMAWYVLHMFTDPRAIAISRWISEKSGRPSSSGREFLWPAIVDRVGGNEWLGAGAGVLPRDFLPTTLSSHSSYFQTYLQLGVLGLALVVWVLVSIWSSLANSHGKPTQFAAAIYLMFVAHNSTEVLMFQNGLVASIPAWCAIGMGVALGRPDAQAIRSAHPERRSTSMEDGRVPSRGHSAAVAGG